MLVTNDTKTARFNSLPSGENSLEREENNVSDIMVLASPDTTHEQWEGVPRVCGYCHEEFMPNTINHRFCSKTCGHRFRNPRTETSWKGKTGICELCQREYFHTGCHQKYCGKECRKIAQKANHRRIMESMKNGML